MPNTYMYIYEEIRTLKNIRQPLKNNNNEESV